jgi:hypothetical protein
MKKIILITCLLAAVTSFAALPDSIILESGNVRVRLDSRKRWNMNRIEYKGELLCVDNSHSHYGAVCRPIDFKFGVGSGHDESGFAEQVDSLKIFADGQEIKPQKNIPVTGKKIEVEKHSKLLTISVKYRIVLENDLIFEFAEAVAEKDIKLHHFYFFMHPWSPRFTNAYLKYKDQTTLNITFKSNHSFPNRKFAPYCAWYDKKSGFGVATMFATVKGGKKLQRFIWDRPQYRKDYLCDYFIAKLPAGYAIAYRSTTAFFCQKDNQKWISDANNVFKKIKF